MDNGKNNLKKALLGMVIILSIILGFFLVYYAGEKAYKAIFKKKIRIEYFSDRLISEVKRMNTVISAAQNTPVDLATILEFHPTSEEEMKILLRSVLFNNEEICGSAVAYEPFNYNKDSLYYSFYAYRSNDSVTFSNLNGPVYNYFYKDWYLIPKTLKQPVWSEPYFDEGGGNLLMSTYSVPFYQFLENGEEFAGIVTIDVSIEWLADAVASVGSILHSRAALISENGTILAAPNRELVYNETIFTIAEERKLPVLRDIGRELQQGKSGFKKGTDEGKVWYIFYSVMPTNGWGIILFVSEDELMERETTSLKELL
ncbi:MAG: cache domain-containing protein [Prolixibacteraceae bacterium]|jgi:sigma-B regulation protein RsbU (phosphoserine phosphatase)|nr:cache domain-containing protein [Prolixibacteraceae bacterium]